jgi:HK97 family phage major capsid protein
MDDPMRRAFMGERGQETARRAGMWARATLGGSEEAAMNCRRLGIPIERVSRAAGQTTNSAGGFLVPAEIENEIFSLRDSVGVFRQFARSIPMGNDVRHWPRRLTGVTAAFTAESIVAAESNPSFDNITSTARKLTALTRISGEIFEDEDAGLGRLLTEEIAYASASKEDDCGFNGDGTSTYGGIVGLTVALLQSAHGASKVTAASGHNTFATLDVTDLGNTIAKLPEYAHANAAWHLSSTLLAPPSAASRRAPAASS